MQIILTAFNGKMKSEPMEVPENITPKFKLALTQAVQFFNSGRYKEKDAALMQSPLETICEFEWTGKYIGSARLYTLIYIDSNCRNKNRWNYKYYGAKGIKVCKRWAGGNGFLFFVKDMGERPKNYQLDRINNNQNYSPKNCRWVNKYVQMGNTSVNNIVPGVGWHGQRKKWRARIKVKGKEKHLGLFANRLDAIKARKKAEKKYVVY